ncbi:nuclear transport factor 2 family protein [Cupriavidus sp. D39]|uniref:nuclear transport factor 2 family protein n=1 Tax=Cupriavidus sp. D39 TaxID=2997877 RepID=UPI00226E5A80|nr:nuclear transport factor 2 family protein [Cupriavidus sp. D39]MCY0854159.1 nuclear transport factor 2 family protein [Cupriavidus sp. D39]
MTNRFGLLLIALAWSTLVHAGPKEDALAAYDKFFTLFTTDNQNQLAALFAPDAMVYGTSSVEVITTPDASIKYFAGALSGARGETKATPFGRTALQLSDSVVVISGKWQSERTLNGKMMTAGPSRLTVVMQKRGEKWLIVQFHSSATPQAAP